ncbi:uncharacterized protein LOC118196529 isoform X2 [Stegodyphus dumicola]|uniref:uncharacterized protein LOC118196529 isoform X2 n=1 Tax=Stegodyphus dumicola TaxID=202533 RepID=UPI0015A88D2C|nr:uncharacterized protein LOC118196529 isoform X2 [Stegodyphus dumicola]
MRRVHFKVTENDTRIISTRNETEESSSEFTSDEAWPKSQTKVMDGAIKVGRIKVGKSKIGSGGGSKTGKNKIGTGGGKSYHHYRYRNYNTKHGSGPVPTYVLIILGIIGGSLLIGFLAYAYLNYVNEKNSLAETFKD